MGSKRHGKTIVGPNIEDPYDEFPDAEDEKDDEDGIAYIPSVLKIDTRLDGGPI